MPSCSAYERTNKQVHICPQPIHSVGGAFSHRSCVSTQSCSWEKERRPEGPESRVQHATANSVELLTQNPNKCTPFGEQCQLQDPISRQLEGLSRRTYRILARGGAPSPNPIDEFSVTTHLVVEIISILVEIISISWSRLHGYYVSSYWDSRSVFPDGSAFPMYSD